MEQHEAGVEPVSSCSSRRRGLGLSFTIDYLLFNKRNGITRGEASTLSPTASVVPYSTVQEQSVRALAEHDGLKLERPERDSEGADGSHKDDMERDECGSGASSGQIMQDKPTQSYIALISMAILASEEKKLLLCDIYQWIMDHYPYFKSKDKNWKNSVRHNLSLNECFIKAGRSESGKGHFWAIHPANVHDFSRGDYQRRRARRRVRRAMGQRPYLLPPLCYPAHRPRSFPCWCCPSGNQLACCAGSMYWSWAPLPVRQARPPLSLL